MFRLRPRRGRSPLDKACLGCGAPAQYGYGEHAEEDFENLRPLCLNCLKAPLSSDYENFGSRAVVVQPAPGPPVYVFQPAGAWAERFSQSKITDDVFALIGRMNRKCHDCGASAKFVWVESRGLTQDNFGEVLVNGISATLLKNNPAPVSLCAGCCVIHISDELMLRNVSYLELCSPNGAAPGFVLPMGY